MSISTSPSITLGGLRYFGLNSRGQGWLLRVLLIRLSFCWLVAGRCMDTDVLNLEADSYSPSRRCHGWYVNIIIVIVTGNRCSPRSIILRCLWSTNSEGFRGLFVLQLKPGFLFLNLFCVLFTARLVSSICSPLNIALLLLCTLCLQIVSIWLGTALGA